MPQKLVIELTGEATQKYLAYASARTEAEVNADCEPSGCSISVEIGPEPDESRAYFNSGSEYIEFGDAKVTLVEVDYKTY
jgi:hypothetical protein